QTEMRALLLHLRPVHLSGESLHKGIEQLVQELQLRSSIEFQIGVEEALNLSETIEEHVFRIIQEAFSNILRHADATVVQLTIRKRRDELFVHIRDNGKGFDLTKDQEKKTSY